MNKMVSASLLAASKENLVETVQNLSKNDVNYVHFDVMDHIFVPNTSFMDDTFDKIRPYSELPFEIHLMVINPLQYFHLYGNYKEDCIIVHYECFKTIEEGLHCLKEIKKTHRVGISIRPNTNPEVLLPFLKEVDLVLVMSVEPGFGGQKFIPSSLNTISTLHGYQKEYSFVIEVDGGINEETAYQCFSFGADIVVSGSYLFKGDMKEKVEALRCEK